MRDDRITTATAALYKKNNFSQKLRIYAETRRITMANKQAKQALEQIKMQAANEVGVNLNSNGYNGDLTSRQAGSIGGQMVKKMIESYENNAQGNTTK